MHCGGRLSGQSIQISQECYLGGSRCRLHGKRTANPFTADDETLLITEAACVHACPSKQFSICEVDTINRAGVTGLVQLEASLSGNSVQDAVTCIMHVCYPECAVQEEG